MIPFSYTRAQDAGDALRLGAVSGAKWGQTTMTFTKRSSCRPFDHLAICVGERSARVTELLVVHPNDDDHGDVATGEDQATLGGEHRGSEPGAA